MKTKKTNSQWIFFLIAIFVIAIGFGLGKVEKVEAAVDCPSYVDLTQVGSCLCDGLSVSEKKITCNECSTVSKNSGNETKDCIWNTFDFGSFNAQKLEDKAAILKGKCSYKCPGKNEEIFLPKSDDTPTQCVNFCKNACEDSGGQMGKKTFQCFFDPEGDQEKKLADSYIFVRESAIKEIKYNAKPKPEICPNLDWNIKSVLSCIFLYLLTILGYFLTLTSTLFGWMIDPKNINSVINNQEIYRSWALLRDILNVSFIMFLLFSAFCTVFQVNKYSYKSNLLTLVLMALLVNFSYPITRFIIDLSNVLMFYFINYYGLKDSLLVGMANNSALGNIISANGGADLSYLIMATIFLFIFTVTLFVVALLFVIRTIALAILVIFSSLAFIGEAIPIPSLKKYVSDWWTQLFNYAFFGPIMVFMLVVSSKMLSSISSEGFGNMQAIANLKTDDPTFIASISFFMIPVILLWFGLGVAKKMSITGANLVVGEAEKFMKWSKGNLTGYSTGKFLWGATGIPGGAKEGWKNFKKTGKLFGEKLPIYGGSDQTERMESRFGGLFKSGSKGWAEANIELERNKVNEMRKKWKDQGAIDKDSVYKQLKTGNAIERKAAALEIAENHKFDNFEQFQKASESIGDDKVIRKIFDDKVKDKHIKFVIQNELKKENLDPKNSMLSEKEKENIQKIYDKELGKLNNDKFAGQDLDTEDDYIKNYIDEVYVKNPSDHQNVFSKLNGEKKKQWIKKGLAPADKKSKKKDNEQQTKRSYEEIQEERAKKAQDEINKQQI